MKGKCYKSFILAVAALGVIGSSCNKLLQVPANEPGQLVTSNVFADSAGCVNGVVGIYVRAFSGFGPLSGYMSIYPSLSADDITATTTFYAPIYNDEQVAGNSTNPTGSTGIIWTRFYGNTLIYQTNAAIEGLTASNGISNALRSQLIGECEVVRSLSYFYLTNLYGAVPIALGTGYTTNDTLSRSSTDDVYAQITKDLTDACGKLSVNYPSDGEARPNEYTAMALLSRVYLYRQQWAEADSLASAIINSGMYQLENINNVFLVGNQEAIWQGLTTSYFSYLTQEGVMFVPYSSMLVPTFSLTQELLNAFEPGDLRQSNWTDSNTVGGTTYYYPYKYKNHSGVQVNGNTEGEVLFRLAEVYLIRAEAKINEGDLTGAAADINAIRNRAGLPNTTAATSDQLETAVLKERQTEFFCEWGHRWLDLKRLNLLNSVMAAEKPNIWPADGHAALYPVPYSQILLNPGWKQNPGY
jgi:hypothetical protein